jgi:hypothetical protein
MCETCVVPGNGSPRPIRIVRGLVAVVAVIGVTAVLATGSDDPASTPAAPATPERVFRSDMARQTADAAGLVGRANAAAVPADVASLARAIEHMDGLVAGRPGPREMAASPSSESALRHAIRVHVNQDRVIARVGLATATDPTVKRHARALLRESRRWLAALRAGRS